MNKRVLNKWSLKIGLICFFFLLLITQKANAQLQAGFVADTTSGCGNASVNFTNTSSGSNLSYQWDFGNGNFSTKKNPSSSYQQVGSYTVQLIISNGTSTDTITKNNYITVFSLPIANFSFSPQQGCAPVKISFTNTSTTNSGGFKSFKWDFSDGSQPDNNENPTHTYQSAGNYTPSLEVLDSNGCVAVASKPSVNVLQKAKAKFTTSNSPINCKAPYTVNFVNQSSGQNLSYKWDFGDNSTSTAQNPSHTYQNLGRYDVTLIVSSSNCADTIKLSEYVILEQSEADFDFIQDTICLNEVFEPVDQSKGARIYSWNFGDNTGSSLKNPKHRYQDSGYFEVSLTVSAGALCTDTYKDSIYVQELIADFATKPTTDCQFDFIASSNFPATYQWRLKAYDQFFDDEAPSHHYSGDSISHNERVEMSDSTFIFSDTLIAISKYGCRDTIAKDSSRKIYRIKPFITLNNIIVTDTLRYCIPDTVVLGDTIIGSLPITSWEWEINNISYFQKVPPKIILHKVDTISVKLKVWTADGCMNMGVIVILAGTKQNPDFSFFPSSVCQGDSLFLINNSSDPLLIDVYTFTLIKKDSTKAEVSVLKTKKDSGAFFTNYESVGEHTIELKTTYSGCDTSIRKGTVFIKGPLVKFTANTTGCINRKIIQFNGEFEGVTRFYWDFDDGSPLDSVNENPLHTYPQNKLYHPMLIAYNDTNNCAPDTFQIGLNLGNLPPLKISPGKMNFCLGDTGTFFLKDSATYVSEIWRIDGKIVSNKAKYKKIFKKRGTYIIELEVEEILGCKHSIKDTIFISRPKPKIGYEILDGCLPSSIAFIDSSITDTTIAKWQWTFGNGDSSNQRIDTTKYKNAGYKDVYLRVENIFGCADSIFSKNHLKSTNFVVDFIANKTKVCTGDSVKFRNISSGDALTYEWRFGDQDSLITSKEFIAHQYTQAGKFQVELYGKSVSNCELTKIRTDYIEVEETPKAQFSADTTNGNCYPFEVNFVDQSTGPVTSWSWYFGDNNSSKLPAPYHNYTSNGHFGVSLAVSTEFGCSDSIHIDSFININAPSADIFIGKDTACINEPIRFEAKNAGNTTGIIWDFGDGKNKYDYQTEYAYDKIGRRYIFITLQDSSTNCSVTLKDSIYIFENEADFLMNEDTACEPFNAQFINNSKGADQYEWDFGDGSNPNSSNYNPNHTYDRAGKYQVSLRILSKVGCKDTALKDIVINPSPEIILSKDQQICLGDSVYLTASGGNRYLWSPDSSLSDNNSAKQLAQPDTTTVYKVVTFNQYNCTDTANITVEVQQPPKRKNKGKQDTTIIIGEKVDLDVYAGKGFYYEWQPPEGLSCDDCPNPTAQPLRNQKYIVKIADSLGCYLVYDTIYVEVIEKYSLDVPSAFTPNGDGNNDVIYAKGWGLKELLSFKIYNRIGEKIFESEDFNNGWDGSYKNKPQPIETYVYVVEGLTYSGKVITKKGNINLMR